MKVPACIGGDGEKKNNFFFPEPFSATDQEIRSSKSGTEKVMANEVAPPDFNFALPKSAKTAAIEPGDLDVKTVRGKLTNVARDWVPPKKAPLKCKERCPKMKSSIKALKYTTNDSNLKTHWFGKELG